VQLQGLKGPPPRQPVYFARSGRARTDSYLEPARAPTEGLRPMSPQKDDIVQPVKAGTRKTHQPQCRRWNPQLSYRKYLSSELLKGASSLFRSLDRLSANIKFASPGLK